MAVFYGKMMDSHQIWAYSVFRQTQLVGPLTKCYPHFIYQLLTDIIPHSLTFLNYLGSRAYLPLSFPLQHLWVKLPNPTIAVSKSIGQSVLEPLDTLDLP